VPAAVAAVVERLSQQSGLPASEITVTAYERAEWPNTCLGLSSAFEACGEAITPGYQVTLSAGGQTYVFRTDLNGYTIRQAR
jgi:hypothetical protein